MAFNCLIFLLALGNVATASFLYDDNYLTSKLDDRYPYLRSKDEPLGYIAPRDYFNFTNVFEPSKDYLESVNLEEHVYYQLRAAEISISIATMDQWHFSDRDAEVEESADSDKCSRQLDDIVERLKQAENTTEMLFSKGAKNIAWLRFIDSWARPPSETYFAHSYWVGSYRGCLSSELELDGDETGFRYCWAKLKAKSWPTDDDVIPATSIRAGVCLPSSCDTRSANEAANLHKIKQALHFNFSPLHRDRFDRLIHVYCLPKPDRPYPLAAKIFCLAAALWLGVIVVASAYTLLVGPASVSNYVKALSVQENVSKFMADEEPSPRSGGVDTRPIGVVKFFASLVIIIAHCTCSYGWVSNTSTYSIAEFRNITYHYLPSAMKPNDLFLVFGGLLGGLAIMKRFKQPGQLLRPKGYLLVIVVRYLRLAPLFVLVLAFVKAVYPHLSSGPMWDYGTYKYSMQGQCQRSNWWRALGLPVVFGYAGQPYYHECLLVSWYLITDIKLSLAIPPLLYLMYRLRHRPRTVTLGLLAPLIILSGLWQYKDLSRQQLIYFSQFFRYSQLTAINILSLAYGEPGYYSAITRSHALLVGLFAGFQLDRFRRGSVSEWPSWMRKHFFAAIFVWQALDFALPFYTQYVYLETKQVPASDESIKWSLVIKPRLDSLMFAIVSVRICTDLAPVIMRYTKSFYKLSKLSYCVFLIHSIIIAYVFSAHERSRGDSIFMQLVVISTFVIAMSFIISFPVYLFFESPMALLLNCLLAQPVQKRQLVESQVDKVKLKLT